MNNKSVVGKLKSFFVLPNLASAVLGLLSSSLLNQLFLHRTALQCPAHSHFTSCLPSCPPSCSNLDGRCEQTSPKFPFVCKEGCICQPGYFLNKDKCVLQNHCDCKDAEGGLIPVSGCGWEVGSGRLGRWPAEPSAYYARARICTHVKLGLESPEACKLAGQIFPVKNSNGEPREKETMSQHEV